MGSLKGTSNGSRRGVFKGSWDLVTGVVIRITLLPPTKVLISILTESHDPPRGGFGFWVSGSGFKV